MHGRLLLSLLHLGHIMNLLWAWQMVYIVPVFLTGVCLRLIISGHPRPGPKAAILGAACVLLLPLCGAIGLVVVPALALWLIYVGVLQWQAGGLHARRDSLLILGLVAAALLLLPLYLVGLPHSSMSFITGRHGCSILSFLRLGEELAPIIRPPENRIDTDF